MRTVGRNAPLTLERITRAAVELLDEVGLAELTTRRLATKLGVQSPTLYWHVANKAELLDLVAEAICADAFVIDGSQPWRDQLASGMQQFRDLLIAHRDAAELLRSRPPAGARRIGHIETTMQILSEAGFSDHETAGIAQLLTAHVLTSVPGKPTSPEGLDAPAMPSEMTEGLDDFPTVQRVLPVLRGMSEQQKFDLGVHVILDGLTRYLEARR